MESQMNFAMAIGLTVFAIGLIASLVSLILLLTSPGKHFALSRLIITTGLGLIAFLLGA